MRYLLGLAVVFLIGACGENRHRGNWPAVVERFEGFSPEEESSLRRALAELNERSGKTLLTESGNEDSYRIVIKKVSPTPERPNRVGFALVGTSRCSIEISSAIVEEPANAQRGALNSQFAGVSRSVMWHEIGHCAGLNHDKNSSEIMFKTTMDFEQYSDGAVERFIDNLGRAAFGT